MKRYRVMYRATDRSNDSNPRTEEVYADGWRVDYDKVVLYAHEDDGNGQSGDVLVLDIPKTRVMRIQEVG
jgi:hypothetical protein